MIKIRKLKIVLSFFISLMPFNGVRCFLYRNLLRYNIHRSRVGWASIIAVDEASLDKCVIARRNLFVGPMRISIGKGASVGPKNRFVCGWWTLEDKFKSARYNCKLIVGDGVLITSDHYFDICGVLSIGSRTWIAGIGSQFWTHGAGSEDRDVTIGYNTYIASSVLFAPGTSVGNESLVALGSVITKRFSYDNVLLAGHPAEVIKYNYKSKV